MWQQTDACPAPGPAKRVVSEDLTCHQPVPAGEPGQCRCSDNHAFVEGADEDGVHQLPDGSFVQVGVP